MSEDKDDLKSIKVYKFNHTKESWHEFAFKFRVIADYRGYDDIIEGKETAPDEKENLEILEKDSDVVMKSMKVKQLARTANRKGFRDMVMSTDGISLNIVQNSTSEKLSKEDLKKARRRLERRWNPKTREDKVLLYTKFLNYKLENVKQRPMDWLAFMEKKRNELANTGHIMDDETFITHLLNSLPQVEYEGVILVVKERLRSRSCDVAEVEQLLEDKYLSMKCVSRAGRKRKTTMHCLLALQKRRGRKHSLKDNVANVERLDTKQRIVPRRKARKKRTLKTSPTKKRRKNLRRTIKERAKLICQKLSALIVEKWVILPGTARNRVKMLI